MNLPPVIVSRRSKGTRRPELTLSPGPAHLAQPGAGSYAELYGCPWALALHRDGPQLYQLSAGEWVPRADPGGALVGLVRGVRWAGLAWDQAARPVIAWELDGAVYIRQWDALGAQYVTRGPWAGCHPLLTCDALAGVELSDTDVLLVQVEADTLTVRVQRDLYSTPRSVTPLPAGAVLDQVVPVGPALYVLGEADGAALVYLLAYPVNVRGDVRGVVSGPASGAFVPVTFTPSGADALRGQTSGPTGGAWASDLLLTATVADALRGQTSGPTGGAWQVALVTATGADALLRGQVTGPTGGAWANTTALHNDSNRINGAASGPTGGNYT